MAWVGVAAAVLAAYYQYEQGQETKKWNKYNAAVSDRDATAAEQSAEYEAGLKRKETERLLGRQRALYGKSGIAFEGSPLLVMEETAAQGELDALMIERSGTLYGERYRSEGELSRMKGKSAGRAGYYGAGTTLLTGAGNYGQAKGY